MSLFIGGLFQIIFGAMLVVVTIAISYTLVKLLWRDVSSLPLFLAIAFVIVFSKMGSIIFMVWGLDEWGLYLAVFVAIGLIGRQLGKSR